MRRRVFAMPAPALSPNANGVAIASINCTAMPHASSLRFFSTPSLPRWQRTSSWCWTKHSFLQVQRCQLRTITKNKKKTTTTMTTSIRPNGAFDAHVFDYRNACDDLVRDMREDDVDSILWAKGHARRRHHSVEFCTGSTECR
jgi:hypothetical protein